MTDMMKRVMELYEGNGYVYTAVFPDEYILMINNKTLDRVRLYFNGKIFEYNGREVTGPSRSAKLRRDEIDSPFFGNEGDR